MTCSKRIWFTFEEPLLFGITVLQLEFIRHTWITFQGHHNIASHVSSCNVVTDISTHPIFIFFDEIFFGEKRKNSIVSLCNIAGCVQRQSAPCQQRRTSKGIPCRCFRTTDPSFGCGEGSRTGCYESSQQSVLCCWKTKHPLHLASGFGLGALAPGWNLWRTPQCIRHMVPGSRTKDGALIPHT